MAIQVTKEPEVLVALFAEIFLFSSMDAVVVIELPRFLKYRIAS